MVFREWDYLNLLNDYNLIQIAPSLDSSRNVICASTGKDPQIILRRNIDNMMPKTKVILRVKTKEPDIFSMFYSDGKSTDYPYVGGRQIDAFAIPSDEIREIFFYPYSDSIRLLRFDFGRTYENEINLESIRIESAGKVQQWKKQKIGKSFWFYCLGYDFDPNYVLRMKVGKNPLNQVDPYIQIYSPFKYREEEIRDKILNALKYIIWSFILFLAIKYLMGIRSYYLFK